MMLTLGIWNTDTSLISSYVLLRLYLVLLLQNYHTPQIMEH